MAEAITVARPYAEAVYKLAIANSQLAKWSKMLQLAAMISTDKHIKMLIGNPLVPAKQLGEIIFDVGQKEFSADVHNLIKLLAENKRILVLPQISYLFEQLKAKHEGVLEA